jgi:deferrochelatase/peroxidase EfeB
MPDLNVADIQGLILRGYRMPALRIFVVSFSSRAGARRILAGLVSGDIEASPQITTAVPWRVKPESCINLALTYAGLHVLKPSTASLKSFPSEFREGAAARATAIGDDSESAPGRWLRGFDPVACHALIFLFAQSVPALEGASRRLRAFATRGDAASILSEHTGNSLPGDVAHFGYRDGIAQPRIRGGPQVSPADGSPTVPPGAFLLGHPSQHDGFFYPSPKPEALGYNGSFVAFRVLRQDCAAFEQFLQDSARRHGLDSELIAAKLCGRWRNGVPLSLSPDSPTPPQPFDKADQNRFGYRDDSDGLRCPVGAHIRRNNPRDATIRGGVGSGFQRPIIRRGLPYGPLYDPAQPDDGIERGLLGLFICASLKDQFEFLMREWVNQDDFAVGIRGTRDPFLGSHPTSGGCFSIPMPNGRSIELKGFSRFVTTRGSAYGFLPSVTAIRWLSGKA